MSAIPEGFGILPAIFVHFAVMFPSLFLWFSFFLHFLPSLSFFLFFLLPLLSFILSCLRLLPLPSRFPSPVPSFSFIYTLSLLFSFLPSTQFYSIHNDPNNIYHSNDTEHVLLKCQSLQRTLMKKYFPLDERDATWMHVPTVVSRLLDPPKTCHSSVIVLGFNGRMGHT